MDHTFQHPHPPLILPFDVHSFDIDQVLLGSHTGQSQVSRKTFDYESCKRTQYLSCCFEMGYESSCVHNRRVTGSAYLCWETQTEMLHPSQTTIIWLPLGLLCLVFSLCLPLLLSISHINTRLYHLGILYSLCHLPIK